MVPRPLLPVRRPLVAGAATALLSATLAGATPFFFCESLPDPPGRERAQGFGSQTAGGPGTPVIHVGPVPTGCDPPPPPTQADLVAAINAANATTGATIMFPPGQTIRVKKPAPASGEPPLPPPLTANNVTVLGNGATIRGDDLPIDSGSGALFQIKGHDVILRDLHFRNGGNDNLRIHGPSAYNIVITHVSSTGAGDDGVSVSNTCTIRAGETACDPAKPFDTAAPHDITIQYSFFAGNTRSMFLKANNPATRLVNVSVHHNWLTRQWVRGPYGDKVRNLDYVNNLVEDWAEWGLKFADGATGNVAYNLFRQSQYAVTLGQLVDPECRASTSECAFNGNPDCPYVVGDPNNNNQKKGFNLGTGEVPEDVYTNNGLEHTNWYQDMALKALDGTAPGPLGVCRLGAEPRAPCTVAADCPVQPNTCDLPPEVFTLHTFGKVRDAVEGRTGPCILTPAQVEAWRQGEYVVCPRHAIDQAYLDADEWCVNESTPFRPPGL